MKRRTFLTLSAAAIFSASTAMAETVTESIVRQLREHGYSEIRLSRTLLGRTRIVAISNKRRREIILNPRTREILRDFTVEFDDDDDDDDRFEDLLEPEDDDDDGPGEDDDDDDDDADDSSDDDDDDDGGDDSGEGGGDDDDDD